MKRSWNKFLSFFLITAMLASQIPASAAEALSSEPPPDSPGISTPVEDSEEPGEGTPEEPGEGTPEEPGEGTPE
ncbi:hypothetical protein D1159_18430, partial [Pseudoflavonifractor sp. 524-17]|uniref:hypothetical protein n=1 Tax=Pseudoflavonifractor sp. 524-17 TaxID=2304577 RepID=UPI00192A4EED